MVWQKLCRKSRICCQPILDQAFLIRFCVPIVAATPSRNAKTNRAPSLAHSVIVCDDRRNSCCRLSYSGRTDSHCACRGPQLGHGPLSERLTIFRTKHDAYRRAIITEPRGSDVLVGGLLCEPHDPSCQAGVIFFNNVGFLGMCGHGLIGLVETLRDQGKIDVGKLHIDTRWAKLLRLCTVMERSRYPMSKATELPKTLRYTRKASVLC